LTETTKKTGNDFFPILSTKPKTIMNLSQLKLLSNLCFWLGFASIIGSIAIWFLVGGDTAESKAHAERFGIFVGLWAPTFFALSSRLDSSKR
jgi:hypothetical protein